MKPPLAFLDSTNAVQCGAALVCLKAAKVEPVWISCSEIAPEPLLDVEGAVAQKIVSCRCIVNWVGLEQAE